MADWKDNKDLGPWDFTEQPDKWGYLNNPRWSSQQKAIDFCRGLNLPIGSSSEHVPCGHWHKTKILPLPLPGGRWVAAMQQPGTPYVYLYDIEARAVIRVYTAGEELFVDNVVRLNSTYALDYDMGHGNPGAQRGAYCMNKDGTRLWYLFCDQGQYPIVRDHPDAELIEVDITSYYMRVVKRTLFPNLLPAEPFPGPQEGRVNDGCSNDTYTYWCTDLVAGRIIKIRNSDHVIVDDHTFNYPIEPCSGGGFDEPISAIDFNQTTGKLYWVYCRDHIFCVPSFNACSHFIRSNADLISDVDEIFCSSGIHTPAWHNMVKIYSNYILHHRSYHPSTAGSLIRRDLDCTPGDFIIQEYLQNILGVRGSGLFTLMHVNSADHPAFLYCLDLSDMSETSKLDVSYYAGQKYGGYDDWDWTSVSALNEMAGRIVIFRYNNIEKRNHAVCIEATQEFDIVCDTRFDKIYDDPSFGPFGEPQVWTMPE